ncbi:MAG: Hsp70 family protein [Kofleriaceae bacterium]|jgi:molecular chaperone DnaK|nr:Hsp70 family protein [Kofleriaceae bacterium]MBP9168120.1 Hsp70 family protein [Kofleriaceae bacterium]MBP9856502.1 Hsp70 family protein [Kofleriaceae bacterium]
MAGPRDMTTIVGIDLGTTNTSVAAVSGTKVSVLAPGPGLRSFPSVVSLPNPREVLVGLAARARLATDPSRTIASPKRLLGRKHAEREVQSFVGAAPYPTRAGADGTTVIEIDGEGYAVPQLVAHLLAEAKAVAERHLGEPVEHAVLAVPVSFDEHRCRAVETAARLAGLEVDGLIAEPNAAALANRYVTGFGGLVGIYDFGGGTFDFSIVDVSRSRFQVVAAAGDPWLGGDDIDTVLAEAAINQFWRQHKVDLRRQVVEYQRIRFACEEAKRALSSAPTATLHVRDVLRTTDGMIDLRLTLDGPTLARAAGAIIRRSLDVCTQTLRKAGVNADQLTGVYLCGGSSQMPAIREAVQRFFGVPLHAGVPPEQAVCLGAAIHASLLAARRSSPVLTVR